MASEVSIKYTIDATDLRTAQSEFDKLTKEEKDALDTLKKFNDKLKETGDGAEDAGKKLKDLGASNSIARLTDKAKKLRDELSLLSPTTQEFANKVKQLQSVEKHLTSATNATKGAQSGFAKLTEQLGPMGGLVGRAFAAGAILSFGQAAIQAAGKHQALMAQLKMVAGTTSNANIEFIKLREQAKFLGLDFDAMSKSFSGFATASKFAGSSMSETKYQFNAISRAASAMSLSADDTQGVFLALQQMMSKGTVSAEELRGQLGERLPGAFTIFAQSLGVTEQELNKMLQTGSVLAKDALPAFALALNDAFAPQTLEQLDAMNKKTANLSTSWQQFVETLGTTIAPIVGPALDFVSYSLTKVGDAIHYIITERNQLELERMAKLESNVATNAEIELNQKIIQMRGETGQAVTRAQAAQALLNETKKAYEQLSERAANPWSSGAYKNDLRLANVRKSLLEDEVKRAEDAEKAKQRMKDSAAAAAAAKAKADADKAQKEYEQNIKKQYDAQMKNIEDTKKIAEIELEMSEKGANESALIKLQIEERYMTERILLNQKFHKKIPKLVQDETKVWKAEREKVWKELDSTNELMAMLSDMPAPEPTADERWVKAQAQIDAQNQERMQKEYDAKAKQMQSLNTIRNFEIDAEESAAKKMAKNAADKEKVEVEFNNKRINAQIEANNQLVALNNEFAAQGFEGAVEATKTKNNELIAENKALQAQLTEDTKAGEEERMAIKEAANNLTQTLMMGGFDLYNQYLNKELEALNKKYATEIEMAGENKQEVDRLKEKQRAEEKEIRMRQFRADQAMAVAKVIFDTASLIAKWKSNPITWGLAALTLANQAAQIGLILAQPVPEFAEGTQGNPHKGGLAMVGEKGVEKVVTKSGKVYFTPPTATLVDLPEGAEVISNAELRKEVFFAKQFQETPTQYYKQNDVVAKLSEIGGILKGLPIQKIQMDERGFQKFVQTPSRTTKILNNRFPTA